MEKTFRKIVLFLFVATSIAIVLAQSRLVQQPVISIATLAPNNQLSEFPYRVPKGYDAKRREAYRVVVIFGGRNTNGKKDAAGHLGWGEWADEHGMFLLCPGFKDDSYWVPKAWSGRALQHALEGLKKQYHVCIDQVLVYGYSTGAQAANLFAEWRPELTRAWAGHGCEMFHEPSTKMRTVPGLLTCAVGDERRHGLGRQFVEKCRGRGVTVLWRAFPNEGSDVSLESLNLARAFLLYYHELYRADLRGRTPSKPIAVVAEFIGDENALVFHPAQAAQVLAIAKEKRVPLPNRAIAEAWGKEAEGEVISSK